MSLLDGERPGCLSLQCKIDQWPAQNAARWRAFMTRGVCDALRAPHIVDFMVEYMAGSILDNPRDLRGILPVAQIEHAIRGCSPDGATVVHLPARPGAMSGMYEEVQTEVFLLSPTGAPECFLVFQIIYKEFRRYFKLVAVALEISAEGVYRLADHPENVLRCIVARLPPSEEGMRIFRDIIVKFLTYRRPERYFNDSIVIYADDEAMNPVFRGSSLMLCLASIIHYHGALHDDTRGSILRGSPHGIHGQPRDWAHGQRIEFLSILNSPSRTILPDNPGLVCKMHWYSPAQKKPVTVAALTRY